MASETPQVTRGILMSFFEEGWSALARPASLGVETALEEGKTVAYRATPHVYRPERNRGFI
jgi:hypothetical protein